MAMKREDATCDMSRWLVLIPPFFLSLYLPPHVLAYTSSSPSPHFSSWSVGERHALSVPASKNLLDTEVADSEPVRHARERASRRPRVSAHYISSGESRALPSHPPFTGLSPASQLWHANHGLDHSAYIADVHLGLYNTIIVAVFIALIGHITLIVSAVPGVIKKSQTALGMFLFAQIIMGFGTGLFKANISLLVAEQYPPHEALCARNCGPDADCVNVYMYFYLFINVGALVSQITTVYSEKYIGSGLHHIHWTISASSVVTKNVQ
ncbi:POT family-domain-containing protein [Mycena olivaceomarginata]|nr:POT family-domain-containing protein [Mycena olivaceomarginata]